MMLSVYHISFVKTRPICYTIFIAYKAQQKMGDYTMTIEEFIKINTETLGLSADVIEAVRADLRAELFELMEEGRTEQEAIDALGDGERAVATLILRHDEKIKAQHTSEGKLPMMYWWALMLSVLLVVLKAMQYLLMSDHTALTIFAFFVGVAGLAVCGVWALVFWYKKKKQ